MYLSFFLFRNKTLRKEANFLESLNCNNTHSQNEKVADELGISDVENGPPESL